MSDPSSSILWTDKKSRPPQVTISRDCVKENSFLSILVVDLDFPAPFLRGRQSPPFLVYLKTNLPCSSRAAGRTPAAQRSRELVPYELPRNIPAPHLRHRFQVVVLSHSIPVRLEVPPKRDQFEVHAFLKTHKMVTVAKTTFFFAPE